jgi:hypothetical protein
MLPATFQSGSVVPVPERRRVNVVNLKDDQKRSRTGYELVN